MFHNLSPSWLPEWLETWLTGDFLTEIVIEDKAQDHEIIGLSALAALLARSFTQKKLVLVRAEFADTELCLEGTFSGCHSGLFVGIPPTQRSVRLPVTLRCAIHDGQLRRITVDYDAGLLLRQMGLVSINGGTHEQQE